MEPSKFVENLATSITQSLMVLGVLELSILAWLLPEYAKKYSLGKIPPTINVLGVSFGADMAMISFGFIVIILILLLKPIMGLIHYIENKRPSRNDLSGLFDVPTVTNIFFIPGSLIAGIPTLIQYGIVWAVLFMPFSLGLGGYLSSPGRGSFVSIMGPTVLFGILGVFISMKVFRILQHGGISKSYFVALLVLLLVAVAVSTCAFYLLTG